MKVTQIYEILKDVMAEVTGLPIVDEETSEESYIVAEDLSNIVSIGEDIDANNWRDNYVKALINRIGKEVFVNRTYSGYAPTVLKDSWEYGSIMSKTRAKIFAAKANPSWKLEKGQTVNQFEFSPPDVTQKFYNSKTAWQIDCSFTDYQIRESFMSVEGMNRFYSMIENRVNDSMTIYSDSLIMRTINNFIAEKINAKNGVIDLLADYNTKFDTSLTAADAITNKDFFRYAALQIKLWVDRFRAPSANFNIPADEDGNITYTPKEYQHLVLHSDLAAGMEVYLQSDTYHDDLVKIGDYETVPFWQTQGSAYSFDDTSAIDVIVASDGETEIVQGGIVGVLFDNDALGVLNDNRRTTTAYNANGEYWTNFYKVDTSYFNDLAENGLVFVLGLSDSPAAASIELDKTSATIIDGETLTLTATTIPADSVVTWESSNTAVATVSDGVVTGVNMGSTTITASITVEGKNYEADCEVTVIDDK